MRRGNGRPGLACVQPSARPAPGSAGNVHARRGQSHIRAALRERGELIGVVNGGHGEHTVEGGRIVDRVVAVTRVARGGHHERALVLGVLDGGLERGRIPRPCRADVDDAGALVGRVENRAHHGAVGPTPLVVQRFDRQDLDVPGDAGHAVTVIPDSPDDARDRRPVRFIVLRTRRVVHEVVPLIQQQIRSKVRMRQVDPRIQDGDDDIWRRGTQVPGLLHPNPPQVPLVGAVQGIVRHDLNRLLALELRGTDHVGVAAQRVQHGV
jgi:hypothetical protein